MITTWNTRCHWVLVTPKNAMMYSICSCAMHNFIISHSRVIYVVYIDIIRPSLKELGTSLHIGFVQEPLWPMNKLLKSAQRFTRETTFQVSMGSVSCRILRVGLFHVETVGTRTVLKGGALVACFVICLSSNSWRKSTEDWQQSFSRTCPLCCTTYTVFTSYNTSILFYIQIGVRRKRGLAPDPPSLNGCSCTW